MGCVRRKWGLPFTGEMRTWKSHPSAQAIPFRWKGWGGGKSQCEVPRRLLLSRDFHILIWGWLSSLGVGGLPGFRGRHCLGGFSPLRSFVGIEIRRPDIPKAMEKSRVWKT